jgi:hypothetical protein
MPTWLALLRLLPASTVNCETDSCRAQPPCQARGYRFTLISGDVHCAGVGVFQTYPKVNLKTDHR